jgi:hypothetical protein
MVVLSPDYHPFLRGKNKCNNTITGVSSDGVARSSIRGSQSLDSGSNPGRSIKIKYVLNGIHLISEDKRMTSGVTLDSFKILIFKDGILHSKCIDMSRHFCIILHRFHSIEHIGQQRIVEGLKLKVL